MEKKVTAVDLIEHEMFDQCFRECVKEIQAEREAVMKASKTFRGFKRSAYDTLTGRLLLCDPNLRKDAIYACVQKRSNLSRRERDFLEHLTVRAGAKLIAHLNKQKTETPTP